MQTPNVWKDVFNHSSRKYLVAEILHHLNLKRLHFISHILPSPTSHTGMGKYYQRHIPEFA